MQPEIVYQCSWCSRWMEDGKPIEKQVAVGVPVSHGICSPCLEQQKERLTWQRDSLMGWVQ